MAPLTVATANLAYDKAITKLKRACTELELNIPPSDAEGDEALIILPLRPRERSEPATATPCALCGPERDQLDDEARAIHVCTHRGQNVNGSRAVGNEGERHDGSSSLRKRKHKQPKLGVVKEYLTQLNTCLDAFTDAVSVLCSTLTVQNEKDMYQDHLFVWIEHCEELKSRARDTIEVLEAAIAGASHRPSAVPVTFDNGFQRPTYGASHITSQALADSIAVALNSIPAGPSSTTGGSSASGTRPTVVPASLPPTSSIMSTGALRNPTREAQFPPQGWIPGTDNVYSSTNLELALGHMNSIGNAIHEDLIAAEQEVSTAGTFLSEGYVSDLKDLCAAIERKIDVQYRDAGGKVARMDLGRTTNAIKILEDNVRSYHDRLRQVRADLRRARSATPSSEVVHRSSPTVSASGISGTSNTGYKPFLEKLKAPTFSGKIEDWPEFRSVWKDLMNGYPESIQIQHLKSNLPATDAKRVAGVKNMDRIFRESHS